MGAGDEGGSRRDVGTAPVSGAAAAATCGLAIPPRGGPRTRHESFPTLPKIMLHGTLTRQNLQCFLTSSGVSE